MAFEVDGPVLAFILTAALIAALAAGLTPALRAASVSVREILQDESRGASSRQLGRLSRGMVVLTIALAYPLLVAAGLLIVSFRETSQELVQGGDQVLAVQFSLPTRRYPDTVQWRAFWDEMVDWAQGQPGVLSATWAESIPPGNTGLWRMEEEGVQYLREDDRPAVRFARARPGFFSVLGVSPLRGRIFEAADRTGPPVAIVNESFVTRFFPDQDPLGRRVRLADLEGDPWHTIVGVVPDLRMNGNDQAAPEGLYLPSPPLDLAFGYLILRSSGATAPLVEAVRDRVAARDPELPVLRAETLEERMDRSFWFVSVVGSVFSVFGLAALFLSSVGLFGVMAHSVSTRNREIRLRMALGATGGSVFWLILRSGLAQVAAGLVAGSVLAILGTRLLAGVLFGVRAGDAGTMAVVGAVLLASAVVAILQPAIRATRYSSAQALQAE
jgi:predicted permease